MKDGRETDSKSTRAMCPSYLNCQNVLHTNNTGKANITVF